MKRVIVILSCLSIFYAGAVWALEGCRDLGVGFDTHHHAENALSIQHHDADTASHHSHSDPAKVHCPNVLGEYVLSSRVSLNADRNVKVYADHTTQQIKRLYLGAMSSSVGVGPPGPNASPIFPLHLFLSVLQI